VKTIVSEEKSSGEHLTTSTLSFQAESFLPLTIIIDEKTGCMMGCQLFEP
jgi:hypothetical protein